MALALVAFGVGGGGVAGRWGGGDGGGRHGGVGAGGGFSGQGEAGEGQGEEDGGFHFVWVEGVCCSGGSDVGVTVTVDELTLWWRCAVLWS